MKEHEDGVCDLNIDDAEYRLKELVYILHQADVRCISAFLKKKKVKVASSNNGIREG